jgi:hypothetical protein
VVELYCHLTVEGNLDRLNTTRPLMRPFALALSQNLPILLVCLWIVVFSVAVKAQTAHLSVVITSPTEVIVSVENAQPRQAWSFRNVSGSAMGIAERIEDFKAATQVKRIAAGQFRSDSLTKSYQYRIRPSLPSPRDVAHVSWLNDQCGLLMLADLVPEELSDVSISFQLPTGWRVHSSIAPDEQRHYRVADPEKAVFFVSRASRQRTKVVAGVDYDLVVSGLWPVSDDKIMKAAAKVVEKYVALTGYRLLHKSVVVLAPLPVAVGSTQWRAETRGNTVVLLVDPRATFKNWSGQFGVIFTHEILHLWVPNSLPLKGDYDWFFEGFTLYTALLTSLNLKLINFPEYLATLGRVYDSYLSYPDTLTLIEASERRWTNPTPVVYDKGMLTAFLYDLSIRKDSSSQSSVLDVYPKLFASRSIEPADGNEVIIKILASAPDTQALSKSYVEGRKPLDLETVLPGYGLQLDTKGSSSRLTVKAGLTRDEVRLLRSLGYR